MATQTTNYHLSKPDAGDQFSAFRQSYNDNMDIIDANLGGGGGGDSVSWNQIQQTGTKIAEIDINGTTTDVYSPTSGGATSLSGLSDVSISTPITNDALIYDGAEWANTALSDVAFSGDYNDLLNKPTIPTTLGALNDVTISGQTSGEVLQYNGSQWVNSTISVPSDLDDLSDVSVTAPTNGEVLKYNNGTWENSPDNVGDTVTWTQTQLSGTKIAEISINGASTDVYAPTGGGGSYTAGDGIDITGSTISLEYLEVVGGKVCLIFDDGM